MQLAGWCSVWIDPGLCSTPACLYCSLPQVVPEFVSKITQIFDCKAARHGNMLVGRTGAGKSEAWRCLARAMARLKRECPGDARFQDVSGPHV